MTFVSTESSLLSRLVSVLIVGTPLGLMASPILWGVFGLPQSFLFTVIDSVPETILAAIVGVLCLPLAVVGINGMAWLNARWASFCLRRI